MYISLLQIIILFFGFLIIGPVLMLPTLVAISRKHPKTILIALVNCILGWTVIGWGIALVWSFSRNKTENQK
ncbi:superinfection immunity protein [Alphaproteobacteria bacterium]|nr:superinfection immunity protein [Alphaproteobacteria bacterium]